MSDLDDHMDEAGGEASSWTLIRESIAQWVEDNRAVLGVRSSKNLGTAIADRYLAETQRAIRDGLNQRDRADVRLQIYRLSRDSLRRAMRQYGPNGQRGYWWDLLHAQWPLFTELKRGRKQIGKQQRELTQVKPIVAEIVEYSAGSIAEEVAAAAANPEQFDWITIDPVSLGHFCNYSRVRDYRTLAESLLQKYHLNGNRFPQSYCDAPSGRRYYQGLNLQGVPSVVRRAALGRHCEYDLNTSVYSWQMVALRLIDNLPAAASPAGTSYTREYIDNKKQIREQLSQHMHSARTRDERLRRVKQAITAIGFGARRTNAYYQGEQLIAHGIAGVIHNQEDRERFLADSWVKGFLQEQTAIVQRIVDGYLAACPENRTDPLFQHRERFSPKRYVAMLYQRFETAVMQRVMELVEDRELLLWVHDCVYTRRPVNLQEINSILKLEFGDGIQLVSGHPEGLNQSVDPWQQPAASVKEQREQKRLDHEAEILWHELNGRSHEYCMNSSDLHYQQWLKGQNQSLSAEKLEQEWQLYQDRRQGIRPSSDRGYYDGTSYDY